LFEREDDPKLPATETHENFTSGLRWLLAGIAECAAGVAAAFEEN
jgi:hypothetical protein